MNWWLTSWAVSSAISWTRSGCRCTRSTADWSEPHRRVHWTPSSPSDVFLRTNCWLEVTSPPPTSACCATLVIGAISSILIAADVVMTATRLRWNTRSFLQISYDAGDKLIFPRFQTHEPIIVREISIPTKMNNIAASGKYWVLPMKKSMGDPKPWPH